MGFVQPSQLQLINVSAAVLSALNQPDIQSQIQKILQNGGLTPENQQAINALLAQLQNQQNSQVSQLLKQPFVLFGSGKTLSAVVIPAASANLNFNTSLVNNLMHIFVRALQRQTA